MATKKTQTTDSTETKSKSSPAGKSASKAGSKSDGGKEPKVEAGADANAVVEESRVGDEVSPAPRKSTPEKKAVKSVKKLRAAEPDEDEDEDDRTEVVAANRLDIGTVASRNFNPIAHEDAELTSEQVHALFEKLMEERNRVVDGFRRHVGEVIQDGDQLADELDLSARNSEQAYLLRFADKERKLLDEIDHALQKMEIGEYGVCEGTGEPITFRRLELRPWTRYSVAFKEQLERWKVD